MRRDACIPAAIALTALITCASAETDTIPPAFGPHVNLKPANFHEAESFRSSDRIVGTYYFYWYDSHSKSHLVNGDGSDALTTHPPTLEDFSYTSVRWHKQQLLDMIDAGIDVVLPVFWGAPSEHDSREREEHEGPEDPARAKERQTADDGRTEAADHDHDHAGDGEYSIAAVDALQRVSP